VLVLATFLIIVTVLILVGSVKALIQTIPSMRMSHLIYFNIASLMIYRYPEIISSECNPFLGYDLSQSRIFFLEQASWIGLFVSGLGIPSSINLMRMSNWGRIFALLLGIALIILGSLTFFCSAALGVIPPIFGVVTITYLLSEVKYKFEVTPEKVEHYIKGLQDKNWIIRAESARALKTIGGKNEVEPLIRALEDPDWRVRKDAAAALGRIGDERAIEPLTYALKDQNKIMRTAAKLALIRIKKRKEQRDASNRA
jgi:hypothetical protein